MRDALTTVAKILGLSLLGALMIRYLGPLAPLPQQNSLALALVLLPPALMGVWLWRRQQRLRV